MGAAQKRQENQEGCVSCLGFKVIFHAVKDYQRYWRGDRYILPI